MLLSLCTPPLLPALVSGDPNADFRRDDSRLDAVNRTVPDSVPPPPRPSAEDPQNSTNATSGVTPGPLAPPPPPVAEDTVTALPENAPGRPPHATPYIKRLSSVLWRDFEIFLADNALYFSGPLRWNGRDWAKFGILSGTQALQIGLVDAPVREALLEYNQDLDDDLHEFLEIVEIYGEVGWATVGGAVVYSYGLFSEDKYVRTLGLVLTESIFASGVLALGVRYVAGRNRPYRTDDPVEFTWFEADFESQAWPSGHVILAFGLSSVLAGYFDEPWAYAAFYGLAGFVAVSRVYTNGHWLSDVTLATAMGLSSGLFALDRLEERRSGIVRWDGFNWGVGPGSVHFSYRF